MGEQFCLSESDIARFPWRFSPKRYLMFLLFWVNLLELLLKIYIYIYFLVSNHSWLFSCYIYIYIYCSYFIVGNYVKKTIFKWCNYLILVGSRTFKNMRGTLSKERYTNARTNLYMHLKFILDALISRTLKISIASLLIYPQECSKTNC